MNHTIQYSLKSFKDVLFSIIFVILFFSYAAIANSASPLNINSATAEQLSAVMNGVGVKKAQAIIEYRNKNGDFSKLDDLVFVKGIGPSVLEKNREMLSIGQGEPYEAEIIEDVIL